MLEILRILQSDWMLLATWELISTQTETCENLNTDRSRRWPVKSPVENWKKAIRGGSQCFPCCDIDGYQEITCASSKAHLNRLDFFNALLKLCHKWMPWQIIHHSLRHFNAYTLSLSPRHITSSTDSTPFSI